MVKDTIGILVGVLIPIAITNVLYAGKKKKKEKQASVNSYEQQNEENNNYGKQYARYKINQRSCGCST